MSMTWKFQVGIALSIEPENETTIKCLVNTYYLSLDLSFIESQTEKILSSINELNCLFDLFFNIYHVIAYFSKHEDLKLFTVPF